MGYCAALYCQNGTGGVYKNSSVSFYRFPLQNKPLLNQWIQNMGRDMETPSKYQCLCSEHFEESSFEKDPPKSHRKRRLLKEAVPNKFILGRDGTWLVGTPRGSDNVMNKNSRKRIRNSEPSRDPGMFPQWPRLEDWQNEFYKQLLKEKHGAALTLGKDHPVTRIHIPAGRALQVKDPQGLEGRKTPASLSTGYGGAMIQDAGGTQLQGSSLGASQALPCHSSEQAGTSGSHRTPDTNPDTNADTNPANLVGIWSGTTILAGQELDKFKQFGLDHPCQPKEAAVPWFICTECGQSFAYHSYLLQHQRSHTKLLPAQRGNPPCTASSKPPSTPPPGHQPACGTAVHSAGKKPGGGVGGIRLKFGDRALLPN